MIDLEQFLDNVKSGILSDSSPINQMNDDNLYASSDILFSSFQARQECTKMGMWAIIDKKWTRKLAKWINGRKCLEIMAGAGWLANALNFHGVDIIATDDYSWKDKQHKNMKMVYPIEEISGIKAVKKYNDRDILIISWPPYESEEICNVCNEWNDKPIIYIGEGIYGCCAPESFWKNFKEIEDNDPKIKIPRWYGINDYLWIGYWNKIESKKVKNAINQLEVSEV